MRYRQKNNIRYERKYLKLLKRISSNLQEYRIESGLTQERISEIVGFSTRYYQKLESGTQSANLLTLYKVCKCLKIDVGELFFED